MVMGVMLVSTVSASDLNDTDVAIADDINSDIDDEPLKVDDQQTSQENETIVNETQNSTVEDVSKQAILSASKLTTTYKNSKNFKVKVVDENGTPIGGVKISLKIFTGSKSKTKTLTTDDKGIVSYNAKSLSAGTHKVVIDIADELYDSKQITSSIKVKPKSLKALAYSEKSAEGGGVGVQLIDKSTLKGVNGIKITFKIYTGKKFKTIKLISGYGDKSKKDKGLAMFMTNRYSAGTHKVIISSGSSNYKFSKSTKLIITKKSKKIYPTYLYTVSNGKEKFKFL